MWCILCSIYKYEYIHILTQYPFALSRQLHHRQAPPLQGRGPATLQPCYLATLQRWSLPCKLEVYLDLAILLICSMTCYLATLLPCCFAIVGVWHAPLKPCHLEVCHASCTLWDWRATLQLCYFIRAAMLPCNLANVYGVIDVACYLATLLAYTRGLLRCYLATMLPYTRGLLRCYLATMLLYTRGLVRCYLATVYAWR